MYHNILVTKAQAILSMKKRGKIFSANKPSGVTISQEGAPHLPQLRIGPLIDWAGENIPDSWCQCLHRETV